MPRTSHTSLARRALKRLGPDYVVTDIVHSTPGSGRKYDVVFVAQRWMGVPVYGGRRSVVFFSRGTSVTGTHVPIRSVTPVLPEIDPEKAVRIALRRVAARWEKPMGRIELLSKSTGLERTTVFRVEPMPTPVSTRLVVCRAKRRARLAWMVMAELPGGHGLEKLIDAGSGRVLHQRSTSHSAASACLDIHHDAGGPAGPPGLKFPVAAAWLDPALRLIECRRSDGSVFKDPKKDASGDFCGQETPFEQKALNALVIANMGLELLKPLGGASRGRVLVTLINSGKKNVDQVAIANPLLDPATLTFTAREPGKQHAASDPSVVLHELAHLVLSHGVGGSEVRSPFETTGESGAIMEGLADFLGLTLWNSIRRAPVGLPDVEVFGNFVLHGHTRDYSGFIRNPGTAPKFPFSSVSGVHRKGMGLCLALWLTRLDILSKFVITADEADEVLWRTVCASLPIMPHQGGLPHFCCVSRTLREVVPAQFRPMLTQALDDRNIPSHCPHLRSTT